MSGRGDETVRRRLVSEFGYPEHGAQLVANEIADLAPAIMREFEKWWALGVIPETEVEGYTLISLMRDYDLNPIAAFLTLDWLTKDPMAAKAEISKGYDCIAIG